MSYSILASQKLFVRTVGFIEESVTTRTPEALEERINIICMNDTIVKSRLFNCFTDFSNTSAS